jgi:hypothetical protein
MVLLAHKIHILSHYKFAAKRPKIILVRPFRRQKFSRPCVWAPSGIKVDSFSGWRYLFEVQDYEMDSLNFVP